MFTSLFIGMDSNAGTLLVCFNRHLNGAFGGFKLRQENLFE
jgi:hypothetical protein